jgi:CheY-like chemotaxis protein
MAAAPAPRFRALVVEDDAIIAMLMEEMLQDMGYDVAAMADRLQHAEELARESSIDFALLDINLAGEESYSVAEILRERRIPFTFMSGYGPAALVGQWATSPIVSKPISPTLLAETLKQILAAK